MDVTGEHIDRIVETRFSPGTTPRSNEYQLGFRHAFVAKITGEKPLCAYLPGSTEFDAYWSGRDDGLRSWNVMTFNG
jgi:hypothetical protein